MSSITQPLAMPRATVLSRSKDYAELIKARITTLIVMTAWCGFYLGAMRSDASALSWTLLHALVGIGLVSAGTAAMNQVIERDLDALMRRTALRPLVKHTISVEHAMVASLAMIFGGLLYLVIATNLLTSGLTLLTSFVYLVAYTPLKKVTPLCTFIGAFPGAMPPVLGWTAARGHVEWEAFVLFAIVFFWQFPHFHSIALLYRDDYERAGICMLPVVERSGVSTAQAILVYGLALIPVTVAPFLVGMSGRVYFVGAVTLGIAQFAFCLRIWRAKLAPSQPRAKQMARQLLQATVLYLPVLFALMMVNSINY